MEGLADAVEEVFREIRTKVKEASQHAGIIESIRAFIAAVDWTVRDGSFEQVMPALASETTADYACNCGRSHG